MAIHAINADKNQVTALQHLSFKAVLAERETTM